MKKRRLKYTWHMAQFHKFGVRDLHYYLASLIVQTMAINYIFTLPRSSLHAKAKSVQFTIRQARNNLSLCKYSVREFYSEFLWILQKYSKPPA